MKVQIGSLYVFEGEVVEDVESWETMEVGEVDALSIWNSLRRDYPVVYTNMTVTYADIQRWLDHNPHESLTVAVVEAEEWDHEAGDWFVVGDEHIEIQLTETQEVGEVAEVVEDPEPTQPELFDFV